MHFYYADGIDFKPYAVSGALTITEARDKAIMGTFSLFFDNNLQWCFRKKGDGRL